MTMKSIATAPAKIILLGEHAVVYGQPSIAVPLLSLRVYAKVVPAPQGSGLCIVSNDIDNPELIITSFNQSSTHSFATAAHLLLDYLGKSLPDVKIVLRSDIPVASGLGSGAAVITALIRGLLIVLGASLSDDIVNSFVYETEKLFHGTPSGIDNTVIVYEEPVYFVRGHPIERLEIGRPFTLLIADTGISASTKKAVSDVRRLYDVNPPSIEGLFNSIGALVNAGRKAIEVGDYQSLGSIMNENQIILRNLTVSSAELDKLVQVARDAGALGAKLSGGGRGGNMIAVVEPENAVLVKSDLLDAGASHVYQTVVS